MGKSKKEIDVCIIGSGAGGAVAAYALGKAGFSVLVLEAGPWYDTKDYHTSKLDFERLPNPFTTEKWADKKNLYTYSTPQKLDPDYAHLRSQTLGYGFLSSSDRRKPPLIERVKGVGGTTLHYQAEAHCLSPDCFKYGSIHGIAEDWPIDYYDLESYYEQAENILGVSGLNENLFKPKRGPFPQPPHELSCASQRVKKGFDSLGLHLQHNSLNILSKSFEGRPACNYCNGCYNGCKMKAKGSMDVTFIKKAQETGNVEIRPNSVAREITVDKQGNADSVIYFDSNKLEQKQKAKIIVLSAGALESPRLLLNSKSPLFPDGLANTSGAVGKYFMETLIYAITALFKEQLHSYKGLQIDSRSWDYNKTGKGSSFFGGVVIGVSALDLLGPVSYAKLVGNRWGSGHKDFMKEYFGHATNIFAVGEQVPHEDNMVSIDPEVKDFYGIPVAKITTELGSNDLEMLSFMSAKCREIADAAGAEQIIRQYGCYDLSLATHTAGTCRMGEDPKTSVLNSYCRSHDVKNLFVMDNSCFVTEGGGDSPSLTIHALALRASEHIINKAKKL